MSDLMNRRDLDFVLYEWLDTDALTERDRYRDHGRDTFDAALDVSAQVAAEHFAPHNKTADACEPTFDGERVHLVDDVRPALTAFWETGLLGASMDTAVGGLQFPHVVSTACSTWFQAANVATAGYPFLTQGAANLLVAHGTPRPRERRAGCRYGLACYVTTGRCRRGGR